jgi:RNA polymerase sigma factor (TIGR02999 family)
MEPPDPTQITNLLLKLSRRNRDAVAAKLMPLVYEDLRRLARKYFRHERPDHTLQPTALVHEAYIRLVDQTRVSWQDRTHFFAVAAKVMRRILVDYARARQRARRGGKRRRIEFDSELSPANLAEFDILAMHEAVEQLAVLDKRQAQIVEMRFFAGMTVDEVAEALGVSRRTVEGDWTHAKAWLRTRFAREAEP